MEVAGAEVAEEGLEKMGPKEYTYQLPNKVLPAELDAPPKRPLPPVRTVPLMPKAPAACSRFFCAETPPADARVLTSAGGEGRGGAGDGGGGAGGAEGALMHIKHRPSRQE